MNITGTMINNRVSARIESLDFILRGGLPKERFYLLQENSGTVSVESADESHGATFTVFLPTTFKCETEPEPEIIETPLVEAVKMPAGISILLVEDDEDSREMLKIMFEQSGMRITGVDSAAKAVELIQQIKPDVLISAIGLPHEDGYELIGKIRRLSPEQGGLTPAIALTGYVSLQDRRHAFDVGFQEHLSKPVDIDELLELVKCLVGNKVVS